MHPSESNLLVTSSAEGSVKCFNYTDYRASALAQQTAAALEDHCCPFATLLTSGSSVVGVDVDGAGGSVLAFDQAGTVYQTKFS